MATLEQRLERVTLAKLFMVLGFGTFAMLVLLDKMTGCVREDTVRDCLRQGKPPEECGKLR